MPKFVDVTDVTVAQSVLGVQRAFDVKGYGAVGNGATNDTNAIHAAKTAAGVGGTVYFPAGTYMVTNLLADVADQSWRLDSNATIKMTTAADDAANWCLKITASGVTVTGGNFDASNGSTAVAGNHTGIAAFADDVTIRNVSVTGSAWMGIAGYDSDRFSVHDCTVIDSYRTGIWFQNSVTGTAHDISICNNVVDSSAGYLDSDAGIGIRGEDYLTTNVSGIVVSGNTITMPTDPTIQTGCILFRACKDYVASSNVCYGAGFGLTAPWANSAVISGNVFRGFNYNGVELPGEISNVVVSDNIFDPDGQDAESGIETSSGNVSNVSITGNSFLGFGALAFPIRFGTSTVVDQVAITGNVFTIDAANNTAVYFNCPATAVTFSGNSVDGDSATNSTAIQCIYPITGLSVSGNQFSNLALCVVRLGPYSSAGTFDHVKLSGNTYNNCTQLIYNQLTGSATTGTNVRIEQPTVVQTFTSNGTWTKPEGATLVDVVVIGAGGGGGAGARGPSGTALSGGGGGGGGGLTHLRFAAADLTATVAVTVGTGGTGAAGQTVDGTAGANGTYGSATSFGAFAVAQPGANGGGGGLGVAGAASAGTNAGASVGLVFGGVGGAGSATGANGSAAANAPAATGGGGGGGITTAPAATAGGAGGWPYTLAVSTAAGGSGANGTAGTNRKLVAGGGGGGGGNTGGNGYDGGNGGSYGGGGGGGGASLNGSTSGAGGNGGNGICIVTTYF